jgi:hypothetical protein
MPHDALAVVSQCGQYRYLLRRSWRNARAACFVMLNPSTADATNDDPTVRRCIRFAKDWGYGQLVVVNLFALRATNPVELKRHPEPVGPVNDRWIEQTVADESVGVVVAAWGNHGGWRCRDVAVMDRLKALGAVHVLGLTSAGCPRHPLYVPAATRPQELWPG